MILATPQSPRKLSLDIQNYSNVSAPASPKFESSVPPSPTFSGSWNVNKTHAELTALLKEAYGVIRDRERDLMLAAEVGASLLETNNKLKEDNMVLKSNYEAEIVRLQALQRARSKAATFTIHPNATQISPPNSSLNNVDEEQLDYDESDTESAYGNSSSYDPTSGDAALKRRNHSNSNSGLNFKAIENLRELETKNQELLQQLEESTREGQDNDKANRLKIRKLEADYQHLQDAYVSSTQQIEDLQKMNDQLIQRQRAEVWNSRHSKKTSDDEDYIETLIHRVQELDDQNLILEKGKIEIERRLTRQSAELDAIKGEYDELLEKSKNYEELLIQNRDQDEYIGELKENLEQQRSLVVKYRNGMNGMGMWSQKTSRANSISDRRLSDPDGMLAMFGVAPKQNDQDSGIGGKIRKTLLSELENEWFRELTLFQRDVKKGNDDDLFSPTSERELDYFYPQGDDMEYLSDDDFSFLDEFEVENEHARAEWFWRRWARAVYQFLRSIWRWCRFIIILIAAVFMALYRGPDDILPNDM